MAFENYADTTHSGRPDQEKLMRDVWNKFMHSNALNPMMYPSLQVCVCICVYMCIFVALRMC